MNIEGNRRGALALVGMPGAGKTLCAQHLHARGFITLRFGAIVVDEVRRRGLEVNPVNERDVREELRARHGMSAMASLALPKLQAALDDHHCIVIDGLYSMSEYTFLRQHLAAPTILAAIVAPRHLRYQRLASRAVRPLTPVEAAERDLREIDKLEKGGPIAIADYTLLNDASEAHMLDQLDRLLAELGFHP